ncbi:hypothetical protein [Mangrovihabitans endophyticus]|uniref:Uncharacterized protein n=1 Tax=Mangrovihabitans endophyticus TaxID=1751298 RepID=A0A8J3BX82_9ACTN|nr:hypothetical protein [Mangrovihabitans endophyticus]GGK86667.1 hypothetical protein GCM10012284_21020 [Mangrovihabitans endophyticus]
MTANEAEIDLDGCLVIVEGSARLRWRRRETGRWQMTGVWPDAVERDRVCARIDAGDPVLVILGGPVSTAVFRDECDGSAPGPDPLDVTVDVLDWLPGPLRARGLEFLAASSGVLAARPRLLVLGLLLDDATGALRFARRTSPQPLWPRHLREVVAHLFAAPATNAHLDAPVPAA